MDEREFSDRVMHCAQRLWRVAYLILRSESECDDAVQEALIRAWTHRDRLKNPDWFETYLVRILINTARTMLRNQRRAPGELPVSLPAPSRPESPELRDAIRNLDVRLRLPLILHHIEGYSIAECASLLKLPPTTVKWRLHTARKRLAEVLKEEQ